VLTAQRIDLRKEKPGCLRRKHALGDFGKHPGVEATRLNWLAKKLSQSRLEQSGSQKNRSLRTL
jgi:hypothetical protein